MIDLWPEDIQVVKVRAPVTILREQATLLGQRTKNIVTAEVVNAHDEDAFGFSFYLVGPAIGNYRYKLFALSHGAEFYPLTLVPTPAVMREIRRASQGMVMVIGSRDGLLTALRRIFSANKTLRVIRAILSLSGVEPND